MSNRSIGGLGASCCLAIVLLMNGGVEGHPQDLSTVGPQATASAAPEEDSLRRLAQEYFTAYASRDLHAVSGVWVGGLPDSAVVADITTARRGACLRLVDLRLARIRVGQDVATARAFAEVLPCDGAPAGHTTWIRSVSFRRDGPTWRMAEDKSAVGELLAQLEQQATLEARKRLLERERDLIGDELQTALQRRAEWEVRRQDSRAAARWLRLALDVSLLTGNEAARPRLLTDLALQHRLAGDWRDAIERYGEALGLLRARNDTAPLAACETALAGVYYQTHDFGAAREHYERASALFSLIGDTPAKAAAEHSLGNVAYVQGDWVTALACYRRSVEIQEGETGPTDGTKDATRAQGAATGYLAIGRVLLEMGDVQEAVATLQKSLERYEASKDDAGVLNVHQSLGAAFRASGDYSLALAHYTEALTRAASHSGPTDPSDEGRLLAEVGEVHALDQQYDRALDYFEQSLSRQEQARSAKGQAAVLAGIAGVHFLRGAPADALDRYARSLALSTRAGDKRTSARTLAQMSLVLASQDKATEALSMARQSRDLSEAAGDKRMLGVALALEASAEAAGRSPASAASLADRSVAVASASQDYATLSHAQLIAGEAYRQLNDTTEARRRLQCAIEAAERLRTETGGTPEDVFFDDGTAAWRSMVHLLMDQGDLEGAYRVHERALQVELQDILRTAAPIRKGLTAQEVEQQRSLRSEEDSLRNQLRIAAAEQSPNLVRCADLRGRVRGATERRETFEAELARAHPDLKVFRGEYELRSLAEGGDHLLDDRTALLKYALTPARIYLFALRRTAEAPGRQATDRRTTRRGTVVIRVYTIEVVPEDLSAKITAFRAAVRGQKPNVAEHARELYELLLRPAEGQISGAKRLLIVPDGMLWRVPFEALRTREHGYVIREMGVAYTPSVSASMAVATRGSARAARAGTPLVVVGVGTADDGGSRQALTARRATFVAPSAEDIDREARSITQQLPPQTVAIAKGVNGVRGAARHAALLSLAVPGILSDAGPMHSVFAFADPSGNPGSLIQTEDFSTWDTSASTVVLSRVEADDGLRAPGAGVIGLWWTWVIAGARTVVASRWLAGQGAALGIVGALDARLVQEPGRRRVRPSEAMRAAVLAMAKGEFAHPHYWAGMTVIGDME